MSVNREQFGSKLGFILAAAGSAVGIGNLVGFPVNATKNGGAAFLLIYALFVVLICLPVMLAELAAGRHTQRNPIGAYKKLAPGQRGWHVGGWLSVVTPFMIAVFYMVITVWILGYLFGAVSGNLDLLAQEGYFVSYITSNAVYFQLIVLTALIVFILYRGVAEGIERGAKLMMPALFVLLLCLVIFVLTLDNAFSGVKFYLVPDFGKLTPAVISNALSQAFFSLSLGMGILITYGSYMKQQDSIASSAKMVALADTSVAFLAGLLIIPAIFSFNPNTNTAELSDSSVSMIFNFLPKIFLALQTSIGYFGASLVASVFFLLVFFAALTSQVSIMQVPLASLQDEMGYSRSKSLGILCAGAGLLTLFCILSFGKVAFLTEFMHYAGQPKSFFDVTIDIFYDTILPLNGFFICLLVIYRWKKANLDAELELGDEGYKGSLLERYVNFSLKTIIPVILLLIFINTVALKYFGVSLIG